MIGKKLLTFGTNDVSIFQGIKSKCYKVNFQWVGSSFHWNALYGSQNQSPSLGFVALVDGEQNESFLSTLYNYFCKTPKKYLDFTKLAKVMGMKGANSQKCQDMMH